MNALVDYLRAIEVECYTQNEVDECYHEVMEYRNNMGYVAETIDEIGFNNLHWAVIANRESDVLESITKHKIDVNSSSWDSGIFNLHRLTPFYIACMRGHTNIANLLLMHNADPNRASRLHLPLIGPLTGSDYSHERPVRAFDTAMNLKRHGIVLLLALKEIQSYRAENAKLIKQPAKTICGIEWGYSWADRLLAAQVLENAIAQKASSKELQTIKQTHPALNEGGRLGLIFNAYLAAKKNEEEQRRTGGDQQGCQLF